ncbi:MAG: hypothetical protein RMM17_09465 [Acidobacteriota bacterium]|nr:hypothetical protein [Blastocatellia bacterium]MDW8412897.1 hypothetical protein [Acidobacteriota bacterium]
MSDHEEIIAAKIEEITELLERFSRVQTEILIYLQRALDLFQAAATPSPATAVPSHYEEMEALEKSFENSIHEVLNIETALKNLTLQRQLAEVDEEGQKAVLIFSELLNAFTLQIDTVSILLHSGETMLSTVSVTDGETQNYKEGFLRFYSQLRHEFTSMKDFIKEMSKDFQLLGDTSDFAS